MKPRNAIAPSAIIPWDEVMADLGLPNSHIEVATILPRIPIQIPEINTCESYLFIFLLVKVLNLKLDVGYIEFFFLFAIHLN